MSKKPTIFFCDDREKWTDQLQEWHSAEFDITTINDGGEFRTTLRGLIDQGSPPDIILIDLFHPHGPPAATEVVTQGNAAMEKLNEENKIARNDINAAWHSLGFELLKQARDLCPDIPVAIYTEHGLSIATNDDLDRVSGFNGEWFLKGKGKVYEQNRLHDMLATKRNSEAIRNWQATRKWLWSLSVVILIVSFSYLWMANKPVDDYFLSFIISQAVAYMPKFISDMEANSRKKG